MESADTIAMLRMLSGYWLSQTLYTVASLGIADRLVNGPKTAEELAAEVGADPDALFRLLRGLSSVGVFAMGPSGFTQTPLSETLRSDREDSLRPLALLGGHPAHWQAWGTLLESVRTGKTAFDLTHGQGFFEMLGGDSALNRIFQQIMARPSDVDRALVEALALQRFGRVVDVGGGLGELARRIVELCPNTSVTLFDRPQVLYSATPRSRVEYAPGDFFASVPSGDIHLLKFVLHDWDDANAIRILTNCRQAMRGEGRLFIIEVVVPEGEAPSIAKTHDVNMLVLTGGRERTHEQYQRLLNAAGLKPVSINTTPHGLSVIEAALADAL
jgi:SAM-dependent methyltransferase